MCPSHRSAPASLACRMHCICVLLLLCTVTQLASAVRISTARTSASPPAQPAKPADSPSPSPAAAPKKFGGSIKGVRPLLSLSLGTFQKPQDSQPTGAAKATNAATQPAEAATAGAAMPAAAATPAAATPAVPATTSTFSNSTAGAAAATPATPAPAVVTGATSAANSNGASAAAGAGAAAAPAPPLGPCGARRTHLGYQCNFTTPEGFVIHWSNGTALPLNPCTTNTSGTQETANQPPRAFIHFAVEAEQPVGRLEVGFPDEAGAGFPAEVVYGAVVNNMTSRAQVGQAFTMFRRNARESAFSSSWAAYKRVYRAPAPAHTKLLLCFSRLRSSKMFNTGSDVSKEFKITWASYTQPEPFSLDAQAPTRFGGAVVNVADGSVKLVASNKGRLLALHGALMLVSFGLLLPLGTLVSRHKWMFKGLEDNGVPLWLMAHLGLQLLGVILGVGGVLLVLVSFGNTDPGASWWRPHQVLGIAVLLASLLQAVLGLMRPDSTTKLHRTWYRLHSGVGRLNAAAGIINMLIGTVLMHQIQATGFWTWFLPALACASLVVAAAVALEVKMVDLERAGLFKPSHHLYRSKLKDPFLAPLKANIGKQGSGSFDGGRTPRSGDGGGGYSTASTPLASMGSMNMFQRRRSTASGMGSWPGMSQGAGGGGGLPSHLRHGGGGAAGSDPQQVAISYV